MKHTVKKLAVLSVAFLSLSAFADAQAGHGKGYRGHDGHRHVHAHHAPRYKAHRRAHRKAHRHYRKHHYRPARYYKPRYRPVPRYVAYPAPVYVERPVYARGASIWLDGFSFSIYGGH